MNESQIASVNGAPLHLNGESLDEAELRRRAGTELLRQQALNEGLLDGADAPAADGAISVAASTAIEALIEKNVLIPEPADEACRRYYAAHKQEYRIGERVRARHILVPTETEAKTILAEVKKGTDFAELAKQKSKDPGAAAEGGDLGYFSKEQMVPEFSEAAFKLEKGQVSEPVKSQFGWHIIKVEDKRSKPVPEFEKVKDQVETYVMRKSQGEFIAKLRESAKIERLDKK